MCSRALFGFFFLLQFVNNASSLQTLVCNTSTTSRPLECTNQQWVRILAEMYAPQVDSPGTTCSQNASGCNTVFHDTGMHALCNGPALPGGVACREDVDVGGAKEVATCLRNTRGVATLVEYSCIEGTVVFNICQAKATLTSGDLRSPFYLATPGYPNSTARGQMCTCAIEGTNLRMSAVDIRVKTQFPFVSDDNIYSSAFSVSSGNTLLWKSSECKGCSDTIMVNTNLFLSDGTVRYPNITATFSDYGLTGQNVWVEIVDTGEHVTLLCSSQPLPPDKIITATTSSFTGQGDNSGLATSPPARTRPGQTFTSYADEKLKKNSDDTLVLIITLTMLISLLVVIAVVVGVVIHRKRHFIKSDDYASPWLLIRSWIHRVIQQKHDPTEQEDFGVADFDAIPVEDLPNRHSAGDVTDSDPRQTARHQPLPSSREDRLDRGYELSAAGERVDSHTRHNQFPSYCDAKLDRRHEPSAVGETTNSQPRHQPLPSSRDAKLDEGYEPSVADERADSQPRQLPSSRESKVDTGHEPNTNSDRADSQPCQKARHSELPFRDREFEPREIYPMDKNEKHGRKRYEQNHDDYSGKYEESAIVNELYQLHTFMLDEELAKLRQERKKMTPKAIYSRYDRNEKSDDVSREIPKARATNEMTNRGHAEVKNKKENRVVDDDEEAVESKGLNQEHVSHKKRRRSNNSDNFMDDSNQTAHDGDDDEKYKKKCDDKNENKKLFDSEEIKMLDLLGLDTWAEKSNTQCATLTEISDASSEENEEQSNEPLDQRKGRLKDRVIEQLRSPEVSHEGRTSNSGTELSESKKLSRSQIVDTILMNSLQDIQSRRDPTRGDGRAKSTHNWNL